MGGDNIIVYGKVNYFGREIQITNPIFEKGKGSKIGSIVPIYSLTEGLSNNEMIRIMKNAINDYAYKLPEILPDYLRSELNLMSIKEAIKNIHFPQDKTDICKQGVD